MKLFDNEAEEEHLWKVRESGLGATARIPGEKDAWEGWEDAAVPPDQRRPLPPRLPQAAPEVRLRLLALRPLRPGLHPHPDRLRAEDLRGGQALPQVPRRGGRPGRQLRRVDLRRARRRPVEGRAPAQDVRAGAGPGLRRVQGDLRPRQQDEPAQGGRPLPARARTSGSAPPTTRRRSRRTSSSSTTRGASPTRPSGASGSASAARRRPAPCARATW